MPYIILVVVILLVSFVLAWRAAKRLEGGSKSSEITEGVLLSIALPRENEKLPVAAEQMFASLHGLLAFTPDTEEHVSLEMASSGEGIRFYVYTPRVFKNFVESQIYAQYPDAEIREAVDYTKSIPAGSFVAATEITLSKDFIFPIKTFRDFEVDPLAAITSALNSAKTTDQLWVQLLIRPVGNFWQERGHQYVQMVREGISPVTLNPQDIVIDVGKSILSIGSNAVTHLMTGPKEIDNRSKPTGPQIVKLSAGKELALKTIENKLSKIGFETKIRIVSVSSTSQMAETLLSGVASSFKQFSTADLNSFEPDPESPSPDVIVKEYQARALPEKEAGNFVLTTEELASVFHLPNLSVETPTIAWTRSKKGEPPLNIPTENVTYMGKTFFRDHEVRFGIKKADRRKHMYLIGKTGVGKSTLIKNMIIQDMRNGEGVAVLDPHGQLIDELLEFVPENRLDDVVVFNPADADYPVSLNMLELVDRRQRTLIGDTLVDVFKKYFADSWGPRLEYILKNCILTLLEVPNTSLLSVIRMLVDRDYRKYIVNLISDPQMKKYWLEEFAKMETNDRLITEAIAPIQNKVGQFLNSELIRNIVGQPKSTIRVDEIINNRKLLFVNLASGRIGANNTSLLGAMVVSQLQFAAMRRVDIPENQRADFFLYADEFQNFATDSFAVILSEARKYRLDLTMTHQYIEQMPEAVRDAIFGNVGTLIAFSVGNQDAHFLEREFTPTFLENDFINLGRFEMYLKLQIDDMSSQPFSAVSLPPYTDATNLSQRAIAASRVKYSKPVERVEKIIKKWTETKFRPGQAPLPPAWALKEEPRVSQVPIDGDNTNSPTYSHGQQKNSLPQAPNIPVVPPPFVSEPANLSPVSESEVERPSEPVISMDYQESPKNDIKPFTRENISGFAPAPQNDTEVDIFKFPPQESQQTTSVGREEEVGLPPPLTENQK